MTIVGLDSLPEVTLSEVTLPEVDILEREVQITEQSGSSLSDYQVRVTFGSGDPIFTNALSDGSDIRFTDTQGDSSPYLDHYLQEFDASAETATIWVKVPSIAASSTESIWLYYGDGTNAKTSSGIGTFPYGFYDFEEFTDGQDIIANDAAFTAANDSWYGDTTPTFTAYNSYAKQGSVGSQFTTDVLEGVQYEMPQTIDSSTESKWVREFWMKGTESTSSATTHGMSDVVDASNTEENIYGPTDDMSNEGDVRYYDGGGWVSIYSGISPGDWVWIHEEIDFPNSQTYTEVKDAPDGSVLGSGTAGFRNSTNQLSYKMIHANGVTSGEDLFRIRKWASTEPSVSVGAE